jgi:hypothetical protein
MIHRRLPTLIGTATILVLRVGGIVTSFLLELLIYPVIYVLWKGWGELRALRRETNLSSE